MCKPYHLQPDEESTYFTQGKFMNDYSAVFSDKDLEQHAFDIKGHMNWHNYEVNNLKYCNYDTYEKFSEQVPLWKIPYMHDAYTEDNDTSDEDLSNDECSSDEEFDPLNIKPKPDAQKQM